MTTKRVSSAESTDQLEQAAKYEFPETDPRSLEGMRTSVQMHIFFVLRGKVPAEALMKNGDATTPHIRPDATLRALNMNMIDVAETVIIVQDHVASRRKKKEFRKAPALETNIRLDWTFEEFVSYLHRQT